MSSQVATVADLERIIKCVSSHRYKRAVYSSLHTVAMVYSDILHDVIVCVGLQHILSYTYY